MKTRQRQFTQLRQAFIILIVTVTILTCDNLDNFVKNNNQDAMSVMLQYLENLGAKAVEDKPHTYFLNGSIIKIAENNNDIILNIDIDSDGIANKIIQMGESVTEDYAPFNPAGDYVLKQSNKEQITRLTVVVPADNKHTNFLVDADSELSIATAIGFYLPFMPTADMSAYTVRLRTTINGTEMSGMETTLRRDMATHRVYALFAEQMLKDSEGHLAPPGLIDTDRVELVISNGAKEWVVPVGNFI